LRMIPPVIFAERDKTAPKLAYQSHQYREANRIAIAR
jgi:hypothetical protein